MNLQFYDNSMEHLFRAYFHVISGTLAKPADLYPNMDSCTGGGAWEIKKERLKVNLISSITVKAAYTEILYYI